uniref:Solute carrier family 24 member 2 n=1 Tax=Pseudonaja textilis TaxID=8673 RepID=A0A670ZJ71_PSETE
MVQYKNIAAHFLEEWCLQEPLLGFKKHPHIRKKQRLIRITGLFLGVMAMSTFSLSVSAFFQLEPYSTETISSLDSEKSKSVHQRSLLGYQERNQNDTLDSPLSSKLTDDNHTQHSQGDYPTDLFSLEERRRGAVILHIIGMIYMFVALAIVCDEFFVPSLTVITEKLNISDDVAGATFMAAGGSAPELFTSLIGIFISHSNVGIGTIVGSAVFNILFVIGMCALFSKQILHLTWWPLFRDVSFYILDLILLIIFFLDNFIRWWESLILLGAYIVYVTFMKFNVQVEEWVKSKFSSNKVDKVSPEPDGKPEAGKKEAMIKPCLQRGGSSASLHNSLMRNSIFQLMIHTLDPLAEELGSYGKLKYYDTMTEEGKKYFRFFEDEDDGQPLSLAWPDTPRKQLTYLVILPIVFPLWVTLPDVRNPPSKKFFPFTFFGSITWIAVFSYLMVWWAHQVGETIGISEEIMGLTILAAGTSIPDLITSVIVARKGLGDMAVSSSVGSNIFDITVGLPLPWFIYAIINNFSPVEVSSNGLFCAIVLLFIMLLFVILSIAFCKWKMNKFLGFIMFGLYFIFLIVSVLLEDRIIVCPVSI